MIRLTKSWIESEFEWISLLEVVALIVSSDRLGLTAFASSGALTLRSMKPEVRKIADALIERSFESDIALAAEALGLSPAWWSGESKDYPVYCWGIYNLGTENAVCVLVSLKPPPTQRVPDDLLTEAKKLMQAFDEEKSNFERKAIEEEQSNEAWIAKLPENVTEEMRNKLKNFPRPQPYPPTEPKLTKILGNAPIGVLVPNIPKGKKARKDAVLAATEHTKWLPSRDGYYTVFEVKDSDRSAGLLLTWIQRGEIPSIFELKAASESLVRRAFRKPRRIDISPPEFQYEEQADNRIAPADFPTFRGTNEDPDIEDLRDFSFRVNDFEERANRGRDAIREAGFEAIAWYQPFHIWADSMWGIYVDADKLLNLMCGLYEDLIKTKNSSPALAFLLGKELILRHEMFHAKIEGCSTFLEVTSRKPRYIRYHDQVYKALKMTDDWLEEALANHLAFTYVKSSIDEWQKRGILRDSGAMLKVVIEWLDFSPPGYRAWKLGENLFTWRTLSNELTTATPAPPQKKRALPVESVLTEPNLYELLLADIPIRIVGSNVVTDLLFSAPSRREAQNLLRHFRYELVSGRGKGSHEFWKGPDGRAFILPVRDPLSIGLQKPARSLRT